jgi:hypothetical protein
VNLISETAAAALKSATTDRKAGRSRKPAAGADALFADRAMPQNATASGEPPISDKTTPSTTIGAKTMKTAALDVLNATTHGKFVLFGIARAERAPNGPAMRGFVEVKPDDNGAPIKVNVAAWLKIGRSSGTEYLSLKVGNNRAESPEEFTVGPFYGRLFRQIDGNRTHYFGFIESSEKTGEDESGQGTYATHWQLRIHAKPAVSHDGKTHYITGGVLPSQQPAEGSAADSNLPF